ncbi:hypothetical protein ACCO45_012795 [Purpureocillium lilacinum]|uniref:Uncharacterized protein n=1 Tax=Purpureocillium lilacinum TaxID=33203 RepID=A0ACC4D904_PURLI
MPVPGFDSLPNCALKCIVAALGGGICALADQTCLCTSELFQSNATACIAESCTRVEALATKNITMAQCGQPVLNRSGELVAISLGMYIVAAMFVMIRLGYKVFVIRIHFNMDDWFVLASAVATAPAIFVNVFGTTVNGLGQDIWNLPPHKISASIKYFWIDICLYFLDTTLTKLSIISFYIRTFPSSNVQRLLWATFTITGAWGTAFVLVGIFQCQPISHFWTQWDGLQTGQCASP